MPNILNFLLLISVFITGIAWFFYFLKSILQGLFKKKNEINILNKEKIIQHETCFYKIISSFFPILLVVFITRSFFYEPFQIPSGSMMPTLLIGDLILVEKFAYGIKNPITQTTLIKTNLPKRGDIVVFKHPENNMNYIKRVIGLPGDKIKYDINNKIIKICVNYTDHNNCKNKLFIKPEKITLSPFFQKVYFFDRLQKKNVYNSIFFKNAEENIDGLKHSILLLDKNNNQLRSYYKQINMPKLTWLIPKGEYFMMGDNRDNSSDSRYWGFVPEKNLLGKAINIWMSFEKEENKWPTNIRINRIGKIY